MSARELLAHDQVGHPTVFDGRSAFSVLRSAAPLVAVAGGILLLLGLGHSWWELILVAAFGLVATQPALVHDTALATADVEVEVETSDPDPDPDRPSDAGAGRAVLAGLHVVERPPRGDAVDRER